ncbi:MAG: hypothetical protein Ct9H90mP16_12930 [Candidatus Poseidoniales archaeon]|nr:MAG: hypothetical protein Ct9H90mP16_12930 [Candidatus Poseidoniales archaeon]
MGRRAHASHILLRQKSDAVRLLSEIQEARKPLKTFQKLAKKHSKCPSGQRGGDLGWFDERQMVVNLVPLALSNLHRKWIDLSKPNLVTI